MPTYTYERIARTPQSEQWRIDSDLGAIGRVDLHFTGAKTYGTLAVQTTVPEADIEELIADIDARLVSTADEYREDFVVTVWRGVEFGTYSEGGIPDVDDLLEDLAVPEVDDDDELDDDELDEEELDEDDDELDDDLDEDDLDDDEEDDEDDDELDDEKA